MADDWIEAEPAHTEAAVFDWTEGEPLIIYEPVAAGAVDQPWNLGITVMMSR